ncbi:hypothetical protein IDF54_14435, partial [Flavobacterium sp. SaA2.13]|uniref:His/Gly/Thr/Pro-type tRNA ligase C-terminal domain-containing protein n=1 Tax=Flavobacterium sp. SaA2.13 TaxID=2691898 RepID=UPI0019DE7570
KLIIPTEKKYLKYAFDLSQSLYSKKISNQIIDHYNLKKSLKYANKINAIVAIILGENEYNNSLVTYKNLESGEQFLISLEDLL